MHDDAYVVSFGRIEGYEPVKRYEYLNTLLPGPGDRRVSPSGCQRDAVSLVKPSCPT